MYYGIPDKAIHKPEYRSKYSLIKPCTKLGLLITFALIFWVGAGAASLRARVLHTKNTQIQTIRRVVHIAAPGARDSRYAYVPFEVPPRAVRISVNYQYDRANGNNTIDIGVFDARSTNSVTDPTGFRGWSGGRRSDFFISRIEATPGYLPGVMSAGTWRIILGLYRIAPAGVDVSLKVEIETEENRSPKTAPRDSGAGFTNDQLAGTSARAPELFSSSKPGGRDLRWWSGDLHMHTVHSDGDWTISELIANARKIGLDFICITDHNTSSHHTEIDRARASLQPLVLRGEEITTYGGHANAWGLPSGTWVDFRVQPGDTARMSKIAEQVHKIGALISINHPFVSCSGCAWSYYASIRDFDAIEVWNGAWDQTDEQALTMWDKVLQIGRHITAIASSDSHRASSPIGQPTTKVRASTLSQRSLLDAIQRGRVYLTSEVARPLVRFEAERVKNSRSRWTLGDEIHLRAPETIRFFISSEGVPPDATISLISNGQVIRQFLAKVDTPIEIECRHDAYFRLEVRDRTKAMLAMTNPIYVRVGRNRQSN